MSCLGVLFSLDKKTVDRLKSFSDDEERLDFLQGDIEEIYFDQNPEWVCELDKAWDAIHRTLTDGKLEWTNGTYPLNTAVLLSPAASVYPITERKDESAYKNFRCLKAMGPCLPCSLVMITLFL